MTLSRLIENAVVSDLNRDNRIGQFTIRIHDYPGAKDGQDNPAQEPEKMAISVSARETSEIFGTGIKKMAVSVEIRASLAVDPSAGNLIDEVESAVSSRLQPSYSSFNNAGNPITGREAAFSSPRHKVYGIEATSVTRSESGLERVRVVNRTFTATLLQ